MGRKSELNQTLVKGLCRILEAGNTIVTACAAWGISDRTFHNWMKRGQEEKSGPFFQFFQSVTRARAKARMKRVKIIGEAALHDWRAAAWLLERQYPEEFGRCTQVTGKNGTPLGGMPPIIRNIFVTEDANSRAARKKFGVRPAQKALR